MAALLLAGALTACGAAGGVAAPGPTATRPADLPAVVAPPTPSLPPPTVPPPPTTAAPAWLVGASPLPLRPDGFGQVLPTPEALRERDLPTVDVLPPPADGAFAATVSPVSPEVLERMGQTWSPSCPVALADLRYLTVSFVGFDDRPHTGELVVAASVADDVVAVFRRLYQHRFPIEEMRLPTTADLTAPPTGDGNNTAGYVCRKARGQQRYSAHAYGTSVDVNPFQNPYRRRDLVLPELAGAYLDRSWVRPGMHLAGGPAVEAFMSFGWTWGGSWRSTKDPMHFSLTGD